MVKAWQLLREDTNLGAGHQAWEPVTNLFGVGGSCQGRGLKGIGCGLQGATTSLEVVVGRGVVLFPAPSPEVNVKDWRNKAGIYWEGADLLGTGGQGSINLLLPLQADLMVVGRIAPVPACLSLRVLKTGSEAMAPCMGAFHFLLFPPICQSKQLPTFT